MQTNRIRAARKEAGVTLERLAEMTGLSVSYLSRMESDKRNVNLANLSKVSDALRRPMSELLMSGDLPAAVPLLSWISAGGLAQPRTVVGPEDVLEWVREPLNPKGDWIALRVEGDSMDRISPPESVIFVNRKDKSLVGNACYVIADDEGNATYKRYRANPPRWEAVSTNPNHEPSYVESDGEPVIIGRVRRTVLSM